MADMSIMLLVVGVVAAVLLVVWLATPSGDDKGDKGDKDAKGIPPTQYTLTINTVGNGTTTGAGTYDKGIIVPITATPALGWKFINWTALAPTTSYKIRGIGYSSSAGITMGALWQR